MILNISRDKVFQEVFLRFFNFFPQLYCLLMLTNPRHVLLFREPIAFDLGNKQLAGKALTTSLTHLSRFELYFDRN